MYNKLEFQNFQITLEFDSKEALNPIHNIYLKMLKIL